GFRPASVTPLCCAKRLRLATLPCRCAPAPSRAARGRAVQPPVSFARIREDDARRGAGQPLSERIRNEDMSGYLNRVQLIGNVARATEVRTTQGGKRAARGSSPSTSRPAR